ncbi:hypothetical protein GCM10020258_36540 [Sphingomonas yabuuchiae]
MPRRHLGWATSLVLLAAAPAAYAQYTTTNPQTVSDTDRLFDEPFRPLTRGWMMCTATEGVRLIEAGQTDLAAAQPARMACTREWANLRGVVGKAIGLPRADRALGQLFESFKLKLRGDYLASRVTAIDADAPSLWGYGPCTPSAVASAMSAPVRRTGAMSTRSGARTVIRPC